MARILIDLRCLADGTGGVGRAARCWIERHLTEHPDDICAGLTTGLKPSDQAREFCQQNKLAYLHLRIPNKLWTLSCFLKLASLTRTAEKRWGVFDAAMLPNIGFVGNLHRPYRLLLHDCSFLIEPRWFNWRRRLWHKLVPIKQLIEKAERVDCVSDQTKKDILKFFTCHVSRVTVLPPMTQGLPPGEETRPAWLPESIRRFALLLGGADPRKNIHTALRAIATFNIQHSTSPLVPVVLGGKVCSHHGQCHLSYLKAPDKVSDAEMRYLYKHAVTLLYPSWYEGFGLPLHEAHQFNTPIIASTAGALPETAPPGTVFCHPAKPHEWLMALENLA